MTQLPPPRAAWEHTGEGESETLTRRSVLTHECCTATCAPYGHTHTHTHTQTHRHTQTQTHTHTHTLFLMRTHCERELVLFWCCSVMDPVSFGRNVCVCVCVRLCTHELYDL